MAKVEANRRKRTIHRDPKQAVIDIIQRLLDDATLADIMAELYVRQKVDAGLRQLEEGQGVDHDQAKQRLSKWLS